MYAEEEEKDRFQSHIEISRVYSHTKLHSHTAALLLGTTAVNLQSKQQKGNKGENQCT